MLELLAEIRDRLLMRFASDSNTKYSIDHFEWKQPIVLEVLRAVAGVHRQV